MVGGTSNSDAAGRRSGTPVSSLRSTAPEARLGRQLTYREIMKIGGALTKEYGLGGINWEPW